MRHPFIAISLVALGAATLTNPALAKQASWPPDRIGREVSIPFIRFHALRDFEADGTRGVWLQDNGRRWYYARVIGPCLDLPFAIKIGVDTRFDGDQLERGGRILVDRDSCTIDSLTASAGPAPKVKRPKKG